MNFLALFAIVLVSVSPTLATQVKYCTGTSLSGSCFTGAPADGMCLDVDPSANDQTHSAQISSGNCVFWENYNCQGDHTVQVDGTIADFNSICGGGWQKRISSYKCCSGNAASNWCAGNKPTCT
ncbi:hypothetical protein FB451DRAFT_1533008 [Mycena latifolia]|nr:hypothetical protein FB451DRAFT_1533008 [Mycena latifolia]